MKNATGGFEQRSVEPYIVTLLKVDMQDVAALHGITWAHIGWGGIAQTVEHEVPAIPMSGDDLQCVCKRR